MKAIFVANAVLPIPGLPAIIKRSDACNPPSFEFKSISPVSNPDKLPSCFKVVSI